MLGWAAFSLFYVLIPLAILGLIVTHMHRPRHRQIRKVGPEPVSAPQQEVVRLLAPLPQAIRTTDDKRGAFLRLATCINDARRYCLTDPYTCYYLNVLRLIHVALGDDERSFLQAPLVTGHVADLLDQSLVALRDQDWQRLYVALSNLCALALRREHYVAWQPQEPVKHSAEDLALLEELVALATLFVHPDTQVEFQRGLARWQQQRRWHTVGSDLLLPFSYLAQRMNQPRPTAALAPAEEAIVLQRERYSVAAMSWAVTQGLRHRDYAVVLDLLVKDLASVVGGNSTSTPPPVSALAPRVPAQNRGNNG